MVHMPSHIYFRLGRFQDSIAANKNAVAADEQYLAEVSPYGAYPYSYYPHNVHFLLESARMVGDGPTALAAADSCRASCPTRSRRSPLGAGDQGRAVFRQCSIQPGGDDAEHP